MKEYYHGDGRTPEVEVNIASGMDAMIHAQTDPQGYVLGDDPGSRRVVRAVNLALSLHMPLLVSGEPGSGKTQLGYAVAHELKKPPPLLFAVKSTAQARDLFYEYDAVGHFRSAQIASMDRQAPEGPLGGDADDTPRSADARDYIEYSALGLAILMALPYAERERFLSPRMVAGVAGAGSAHRALLMERTARQAVVIIDEVDKAPRDFPNDLLHELETMTFRCPELGLETPVLEQKLRPIIFITSNSERQLPEAFLRRCAFVHLASPQGDALEHLLSTRLTGMYATGEPLLRDIVALYEAARKRGDLDKPPGVAELLQYLQATQIWGADRQKRASEQRDVLENALPALGKSEGDIRKLTTTLKELGAAAESNR